MLVHKIKEIGHGCPLFMDPFNPKNTRLRPEARVQEKIINRLRLMDFYCKVTHGSEYQTGFPDVFVAHRSYGTRWIEVKQPGNTVRFEESQVDSFTKLALHGVGVWVLQGDSDYEIRKLFNPPNWAFYSDVMKPITRSRTSNKTPWVKSTRLASVGPEREIQEEIKSALTSQDWHVMETIGSIYQYGFPDLYACHKKYGQRWIEVKNPRGYIFTPGQLRTFPELEAKGVAVHVLTSSQDISLLFGPSNWRNYQ